MNTPLPSVHMGLASAASAPSGVGQRCGCMFPAIAGWGMSVYSHERSASLWPALFQSVEQHTLAIFEDELSAYLVCLIIDARLGRPVRFVVILIQLH